MEWFKSGRIQRPGYPAAGSLGGTDCFLISAAVRRVVLVEPPKGTERSGGSDGARRTIRGLS